MMDISRDKLTKTRDTFREAANIIDELITLNERNDNGEDVEKELEVVLGRFLLKMVEMQSLT